MFSSTHAPAKLPERTYGRTMSVQQMIDSAARSTSSPEVDAIMYQLVRSNKGCEQPAIIRSALVYLSKDHLELVAEATLALADSQELCEAHYGTVRDNITKQSSYTSVLHGGRDSAGYSYPYDHIVAAIFSDSSKFELKIIRDMSSFKIGTSDLLRLCHAMRADGVPVTKETVHTQIAAKDYFDRTRSIMFYDATEKDYYRFPGIRKAVYNHVDRVQEVIDFARKRGSVDSIEEFFSSEKAIAEGAL